MTADEIGVSRSAADVRPAGTRRTLAISSRLAAELGPMAMTRMARTAAGSAPAAGTQRAR